MAAAAHCHIMVVLACMGAHAAPVVPLVTLVTLKIWYGDMSKTQLDHWKLFLGANVCQIKSLEFFPIFLTNRVWINQAKSWKWVMFKTLLWQPQWFQMNVWYTIWKYTYSSIFWLKKVFKIQNSYFIHFRTNVNQTSYSVVGHLFLQIHHVKS